MGRWAHFNTGFEYKFAFATQNSADITTFGGQDDGHDEPSGYYHWSWSACCDAERCLRNIRRLEKDNGWSPVDFDAWAKCEEGTSALWGALDKTGGYSETKYRYVLGCLIYHQLTYCKELSCDFEG
jgi:hypothetical protein